MEWRNVWPAKVNVGDGKELQYSWLHEGCCDCRFWMLFKDGAWVQAVVNTALYRSVGILLILILFETFAELRSRAEQFEKSTKLLVGILHSPSTISVFSVLLINADGISMTWLFKWCWRLLWASRSNITVDESLTIVASSNDKSSPVILPEIKLYNF